LAGDRVFTQHGHPRTGARRPIDDDQPGTFQSVEGVALGLPRHAPLLADDPVAKAERRRVVDGNLETERQIDRERLA
jgi:hypothetical protein